MESKHLFVIAAGSGGHILPAMTCVKRWKQNNPDGTVRLFTGSKKLEQKIIQDYNTINSVTPAKSLQCSLRRWWTLPLTLLRVIFLFFKSIFLLVSDKPEKVIATGGILSVPICLAAWITRRPIELYELNVIPGKANKFLLPFASKVYITFEESKKYCSWNQFNFAHKCEVIRYPLRFTEKDKHTNKETILKTINQRLQKSGNTLSFKPWRKTIFVLGGSQGSHFLNTLITDLMEKYPNADKAIQVIHQAGKMSNTLDAWYRKKNIPALTFHYDVNIHHYYILADLVVSRAGAGTLFELAYFNKKSIIIPLVAHTTNHQVYNARSMKRQYSNLFTVIKQNDAKEVDIFFKEIQKKDSKESVCHQ